MNTIKSSLLAVLLLAVPFIFFSCTVNKLHTNQVEALDSSLWAMSEWISAADAQVLTGRISPNNMRSADGASWFVSNVKNDKPIASAVWMTSALGVYDIYVNGVLVGNEFLKPGFTHFLKTRYSFTYDVTDLISTKQGAENQFSSQVTPGWWGDKIITPEGNEGMNGKKCAFRSVLELVYTDGTREYFGTNQEDWVAGIAGPVKHTGIFDGESYDARELPGYLTVDKLSVPEINNEFRGEIYPSAGAEVYMRHDLTLDPVNAYVWKEIADATDEEYGKVVISKQYTGNQKIHLSAGETLVVDFGQNAAAVPSFVFKAKEGTVMTCLPSEILNDGNGARSRGMDGPEGSCHRLNLRTPEQGMILEYTFADNSGYVTFSPRYTFFGYRYISITATDDLYIKSVKSVPVTSIAQNIQTGVLKTGNELINKLISNTVWGMYSNYLSVPTDCPQRDERLGWTADTQVFAETGTYFADIRAFMHKWMRDMRDSQGESGGFPDVAPYAQYVNDKMHIGWGEAGVIVPWTIWKQYADTEIVQQNWEAMEAFMNHVNTTKYDHIALISENHNYQYADWLSYEALESCSSRGFGVNASGHWGPLPETVEYWSYLGASYWAIDAGMMAEMAAAIGRDASVYIKMKDEAVVYIRSRFLNKDGSFKQDVLNTMQTPALFALKNQLLEGEAKANMIARLRENFASHDNCLQTGFLGTSILMSTLTENGMADIAYELLFQRKNPSWLYSVDNGATTIWERWNSYMIDRGMGPNSMNSFNHYAYGCVCEWLWETAAGISADPESPGFKKIIMKPVPHKLLGCLDAKYESAAGTIKSSWKYEGDTWKWEFTVPEGSIALVTLPGQNQSAEYGAGVHSIELVL